jgi:hypothetical protein
MDFNLMFVMVGLSLTGINVTNFSTVNPEWVNCGEVCEIHDNYSYMLQVIVVLK